MDLILRNARVVGNESVATDIGIDKGRIAVIQPKLAAEGETLDLGGRLVTPGSSDPHPSRQVAHPRALQGPARRPGGGDRGGGQAEEAVYGGRRLRAAKVTLEKAILNGTRTCARSWRSIPASASRGRGRAAPDRGVQVGDRPGDLHLPAGGPAQQPRHRRADGPALRAAARWSAPRPIRTAVRTARSTASSPSPGSSTSTSTCISISGRRLTISTCSTSASSPSVQVGRARRHRPRHQAVGAPPSDSTKCARRMADAGVALTVLPSTDLYLMGRAHGPQRHARRGRGAQAAASRRQLHAVDQQRAQPFHAVRRLLAGAHGQYLRQHLPGGLRGTTCASAST